MGTNEYLRTLDLDQLRYARDRANGLIAEKEAEKKLTVWLVQDRHMNLAWFAADDYLKAAAALLEEARRRATRTEPPSRSEGELRLVPTLVPESEYPEWFPDESKGG